MGGIGSKIKGLTTTHNEKHANHWWKCCRRSSLGTVQVECDHAEWQTLEPHPNDVCLLVKQYMHSTTWSQSPLLILPHIIAGTLRHEELGIARCTPLGVRTLKEFRKTASVICEPPWSLLQAKHYIETMCDANEANTFVGSPPDIDFIFKHTVTPVDPGLAIQQLIFDNPEPRKVVLGASGHQARTRK